MTDCIFCKVIKKELPHRELYENKYTLAFLDINPANPKGGHTLVIPKKHYDNITEIPEEELNHLISTVKKISKALLKWSDGLNISQNNKKAGGQIVPHIHFHLIPRFKNDGIDITACWKHHKYKDGEDIKIQYQIKTLLKES